MSEELSRAERRRLKRERGAKKKQESRRKGQWLNILIATLVIVGVGAYAYWSINKPPEPENNEVRVAIMDTQHVADTSEAEYNSNPPTSGPHFTDWHREWKFYEEELPIGGVLHNMEHGGVAIFYQPDIPQETKDLLAEFTKDNFKTIAGAKADLPAPIAIAAWGVYELFQDFDEAAMKRFYKRNLNHAPENVYP
ncbi:MAG: DUF3105 domain-containing protein [Candidatus Peregrinibacteria bacterium]|nr:DUF3105 domain-containing protein [Candidatus Peregrinibacteria bacterium]